MFKRLKEWRQFRKTYTELSGLDDRTLNDIGIGRGDIPFIARQHAANLD